MHSNLILSILGKPSCSKHQIITVQYTCSKLYTRYKQLPCSTQGTNNYRAVHRVKVALTGAIIAALVVIRQLLSASQMALTFALFTPIFVVAEPMNCTQLNHKALVTLCGGLY